jgi:hypothetical protein
VLARLARRILTATSAPFGPVPAAGVVDEEAPDQVRREGEEVGAARPLQARLAGEAQVGLVHDGRRLECMVASFPAELADRDAAQLVIDLRKDLFRRLPVS